MKRFIGKFLLISVVLTIVYVVIIHFTMLAVANNEPPAGKEYIIVLGAKLNGEELSLALYNRVKVALIYLNENPNTKVIVSGGQGKGEDITEAEAMERYFVENGIAEHRILKEEKSTNTLENLKYSKELIEDDTTEIVIVSNDFHLFRATIIAKRQGLEPYTLAAETPNMVEAKLWVREYAAVLKTALLDW